MKDIKKMAVWGAGEVCRNYIANGMKDIVEVIIDNDKCKAGTKMYNIPIVHPSQITNWDDYFIIIAANYEEEIGEQLMGYGLEKNRDFALYKEYCGRDIPLQIVQETLKDSLIGSGFGQLRRKVYSKEEYDSFKRKYRNYNKFEQTLGSLYKKMPGKVGGYIGECVACQKRQVFVVDYIWSDGMQPAWRETVTCPKCGCNSRMRFVIDYVGKIGTDQSIFIYEAVTNTYKELQKKIPHIQGSEYLGESFQSGQVIDGILHQDAMALSFQDESFDYMISNDVLEHVADFRAALRESFRCLKKGGHFIVTVPIFKDREKTIIRAKMASGNQIKYILPPVYHGNPLSAEGSLVFTEFGWDILEELRRAGFTDAYAVVYFSVEEGYFGDFPVIFEAIK